MRKDKRQKQIKFRKNFLPTLLVTIALWGMLATLIYFADPYQQGIILLFFILFFLTCLFTFSMIFANTRRGLISTISLSLFLALSYFGVGNLLNFLLILGLGVSVDIYLSRH